MSAVAKWPLVSAVGFAALLASAAPLLHAAPVLTPPRDMFAFAGQSDEQRLEASDADAQTLYFYRASGPSFLQVGTAGPFTPTIAIGLATIIPGSNDVGDTDAVIGVTDGVATDEDSIRLHVYDPSPRSTVFRIGSTPCGVAAPPPQPYQVTLSNGSLYAGGTPLGITAFVTGLGHMWELRFAPETGHLLEPGYVYYRDPGYIGSNVANPLAVIRDGSFWSGETESYEIREVVYGPGDRVTSFWATFAQECAGGLSLQGEIRYNAHVGVELSAPPFRAVERGHALVYDASASDPDGGVVTLTAPVLPNGATFQDRGGVGTFAWTPEFSQRGLHVATLEAADGTGSRQRTTTTIRVLGETGARFTTLGGVAESFGRDSVRFTLTLPEYPGLPAGITIRSPYSMLWEVVMGPPFGELLGVGSYENAGMSPRQDPANPILEVTRQGSIYSSPAGRFEIRQMERDPVRGILSLWATFEMPFGGGQAITGEIRYDAEVASARTFVVSNDRDLRLLAAKPRWFLQVEPVGSAFAVGSLDIETVRLIRRDHQGDWREVRPLTAESSAPSDRDGNGKPEMALCFERDDLRRFFDDVHGSADVTVDLEAMLTTGERVREPVIVHVTGVYGISISAAPNPLNPGTTVSYYSEAAGHVAIRAFDVAGRLVHTLVDANQPSGYHSTTWFGRSASGQRLASGVYYLRLETPSGTQTLPIVLLR